MHGNKITMNDVNSAMVDSFFHPGETLSEKQAIEKLISEYPDAKLSVRVRYVAGKDGSHASR